MAQIQVSLIIPEVMQICRAAPLGTLVNAYVRAARRFCSRSRWLQRQIVGNTVIGQQLYGLGSDTYEEIVGIAAVRIALDGEKPPLTESSSSSWDPTDEDGEPELYQYVPEGQFALHPVPAAVYELTINVVVQPKRGASSIDEALATQWDQELQDGALGYLLRLPGMPWTDKPEAAVREARFNQAIHSASINAQRGYNPGAEVTDRTGQPNAAVRTSILPI